MEQPLGQLRIRSARPEDAEAIARAHVSAWRETYQGLLPPRMINAQTVARRQRLWSRLIGAGPGEPGSAVVVAEASEGIVGFVAGGAQRDKALLEAGYDAEIAAIYVRKARQGRGLGRALMRSVFRACAARGLTAPSVWVLDRNAEARGFYSRLGARPFAERDDERPEITLREVAYVWTDLVLPG